MKVSELSGALLDYWVAKAEGFLLSCDWNQGEYILIGTGEGDLERFSPSTDWTVGGPIIERERIGIMPVGVEWKAWAPLDMDATAVADELLIAAMRAFVASKFGNEVQDEAAHA
jgi:hypothetical protein